MFEFDVELTEFETAEIDLLLDQPVAGRKDAPDPADLVEPIDPSAIAVSRLGDLGRMGGHRLLCGDALAARIP